MSAKSKLDFYPTDSEDTRKAFITLELALANLQYYTGVYVKFDASGFYHQDSWYYYDCITANGIEFSATVDDDDIAQDTIRFLPDEYDDHALTLDHMIKYVKSRSEV